MPIRIQVKRPNVVRYWRAWGFDWSCERRARQAPVPRIARKVVVFLDKLDIPRKGSADSDTGLFLPKRSRFIALPRAGHKLRGYSAANMIVIDEAAQVRDGMYNIIRVMRMVSRGDLWLFRFLRSVL